MFVHTRHQFQKHLQPGDCWSCSVCSCQAEYETRGGKPGNCPSRWPWHIWSHLFVSVPSRRTCTACIPYFVGTPAIEAGSMVYSSQEEHTSLCSPFPADWWGGSQTKTAWLTALKWWQTTNYPDVPMGESESVSWHGTPCAHATTRVPVADSLPEEVCP